MLNKLTAMVLGMALALLAGSAWANCSGPNGATGAMNLNGTGYQYCNGTSWVGFTSSVSTTTCATTGQRQAFADGYTYACDGAHWNNYATGTSKGSCSTKNRVEFISGHYCTCNGSQYIPWCLTTDATSNAYSFYDNSSGQMGVGDTSAHATVQKATSTTTINFTGLTMGGWGFTCGIDANGNAYCWGTDPSSAGSLGNGSFGGSELYPHKVVSTTTISYTQISASNYGACAVATNGNAYCWGYDGQGQLGDNGNGSTNQSRPVRVVNGTGSTFTHISSADGYVAGLTADNNVWGWGHVLGLVDYNVPTQLTAGGGIAQVSAGDQHFCTISTSGQVACVGQDYYGEVGDGAYGDFVQTPNPVVSVTSLTFTAVSAGLDTSCGVTNNGQAYCWGHNNTGQLGDGTTANRANAVLVSATGISFTSIVTMSDASFFGNVVNDTTCATTTTGKVYCWGALNSGNTEFGQTYLMQAPSLTQITSGDTNMCGLGTSGQAYCWGAGSHGEIGNGQTNDASPPTRVISTTNISFTQLTSGGVEEFNSPVEFKGFNCGIDILGKAYCWGSGGYGQLGYGSNVSQSVPMQVISTTSISYTQISAGYYHVCAVDKNGLTYCWGYNGNSQLGIGNNTNQSKPVKTISTTVISYTEISAGYVHTCAIDKNGKAYCWGDNTSGELGTGNFTNQTKPVKLTSPSTAVFTSIYAGNNETCAIDSNSKAYCWGDDSSGSGRMGDGSSTSQKWPILVNAPGVSFTQITMGDNYVCALDKNKALYCWGQPPFGQTYATPALMSDGTIMGSVVSVTAVAGGNTWLCAMDNVSATYCIDGGDFYRHYEMNAKGNTNYTTPTQITLPGGVVATSMTDQFFGSTCGFTGTGGGGGC